ncbi:hypothetical protein EDB84DRAFT_1204889 [Lactarius hengduanensis]|nr:hypothetical protein EDB84DRAFT_1204889 [Lactarius hengduanensis]
MENHSQVGRRKVLAASVVSVDPISQFNARKDSELASPINDPPLLGPSSRSFDARSHSPSLVSLGCRSVVVARFGRRPVSLAVCWSQARALASSSNHSAKKVCASRSAGTCIYLRPPKDPANRCRRRYRCQTPSQASPFVVQSTQPTLEPRVLNDLYSTSRGLPTPSQHIHGTAVT